MERSALVAAIGLGFYGDRRGLRRLIGEVVFLGRLSRFIALGALPFVGEAWIQFRSWRRRMVWIAAGVVAGVVIVNSFREPADVRTRLGFVLSALDNGWMRGPLTFLPAGCLEFAAALGQRNRPWVWLIVTPALFGLSAFWMEPLGRIAEKVMSTISIYIPIANGTASELYFGATIFGTVLFTRALAGSFIASRKRAALHVVAYVEARL
jgi:hypothetical protein